MRKPEDVHVLVVDDEADVRDFLADVLQDVGIRVTTAENGSEALACIRQDVPDLISTDLVMPGKSGIRLIYELRKNPQWSRIPILIVTGHARDADIKDSIENLLQDSSLVGPSSCLEKPITPQGYLQTVCRILKVDLAVAGQPSGDSTLLDEASDLLRQADQSTLEAIISQLKGKKKPPGP
jgi:CheY-like chemotaxis protein